MRMIINFLLLLVLIGHDNARAQQEGDGDRQISNEAKLKQKLFKDYDTDVRPVTHHRNETHVLMDFIPLMVLQLDEELSLFSVDGWLRMTWIDYRLKWNSSEYDGLEILHLPDHYIWQPDIRIYNGHSGKTNPSNDTHIIVMSNGRIYYVPPVEIRTRCPVRFNSSYPNDVVVCNVYFGSWSHDGWQMNITMAFEKMLLNYLDNSNPRWEVLPDLSVADRTVKYYNCCEEPYITLRSSFALRRRPPPELDVIWSPCVLVMTLTLAMFWIPSGSGKKVFLGTILLLMLSVLTVYVGIVTRSPRAPRFAVSFLVSTMYAVASAVVLEVLVINLCSIVGPCRPPPLMIQFLSGPWAKYAAVWPRWSVNVPGDRLQLKEDLDQLERHPTPQEEWLLVATALDRILFVLYIIVLATIHQV